MPLFAPSVIRNSNWSSNAPNASRVTIPPPRGPPGSEASTVSSPSRTRQPVAGKSWRWAPRQASVLSPSKSSSQPIAASASESWFGRVSTT